MRRATGQQVVTICVLGAAMVAWTAAVWMGCLWYEVDAHLMRGVPRSALNPLLPYDKLLRRVGPLLPLTVPLLRGEGDTGHAMPGVLHTLVIYTAFAALRIALYLAFQPDGAMANLLFTTSTAAGKHAHWLSDHILLGSSMLGMLAAEAAMLAAQLCSCRSSGAVAPSNGSSTAWRRLWAGAALTVVLWALTAIDMHFTARFFHPPQENVRAWAVGVFVFQAPLASWAIWQVSRRVSA